MSRTRRVCGQAASGALLPPAAFAVHQLRYMLAFGGSAGPELQRTGHSYLHSAVPWLILLLALAAGRFLRALGRAFSQQTTAKRYSVSFVALWVMCTGALVAIFATQELLEGVFSSGHPGGLSGIFGYGGWWALPSAACVGLVVTACFHGARWLVEAVACRAAPEAATPRLEPIAARSPQSFRLTPAPLLSGWSTRGPPAGLEPGLCGPAAAFA
jgi:hypothetical protein